MARRSTCNKLPAARRPQPQIVSVSPLIDSSLVRARSLLKGDAVVRTMASDMREAAYREGGLTEFGLELLGYTAEQITAHVPAARAMADQMAGAT